MLIANVKNMRIFFDGYMKHDGWDVSKLREMREKFEAAIRSLNSGKLVWKAMNYANEVLQGHGVEYLSNTDMTQEVAMYVNMGDTYDATIIYDVLTDKFYVGSWGDWYEWRSRNKEYGLEN